MVSDASYYSLVAQTVAQTFVILHLRFFNRRMVSYLTEQQAFWLENTLKGILQVDTIDYTLAPLAGDASTRRYFALTHNNTQLILVVGEHYCNMRFAFMTHKFDTYEVRVPHIFAMQTRPEKVDGEMVSCMLISSVGDHDLLHALQQKKQRTKMLYMQAVTQICQWQAITDTEGAYDEEAYALESNLFTEWFVPHLAHNKRGLINAYQQLTAQLFPLLCKQPYALAHRDYHSCNILINEQDNNRLYTIDYQDAICAPVAYDLVSLLKDVYVDIGDALRSDMCKYFYARLPEEQQKGLDAFVQDFELIGIQRHLKIAGIFVRLYVRDAKPTYLDALPLCLDYLQKACASSTIEPVRAMAELLEQEKAYLPDALVNLKQS